MFNTPFNNVDIEKKSNNENYKFRNKLNLIKNNLRSHKIGLHYYKELYSNGGSYRLYQNGLKVHFNDRVDIFFFFETKKCTKTNI